MVRIGIAGLGFMGVTHYRAAEKIANGEVVAVCTRNPRKLQGDWTMVKGNFGPNGGTADLSNIRRYNQVADIVADPDLDLLDICLPTNMHAEVAVQALEAGKHVLVEKPIALTVEDADRMVETAKRKGRKLMVAQVLRFIPEFAFIKKTLDSGLFGRLLAAHFKRIISRPEWSADIADVRKTGGPIIDLHIHDADFVQYLFGMPDRVAASGLVVGEGEEETVEYVSAHYFYDGQNLSITAESGAVATAARPFEHGYDVYFERATLQFNSTWGQPVTVYVSPEVDVASYQPDLPVVVVTPDGERHEKKVELETDLATAGFVGEVQYAVDCVEKDKEPTLIAGAVARDSLLLCLKAAEAVKTRQTVSIAE
ncbi:MAG TPA: Gfo/Idh/MocA family oxidoreductase [Armatimonadetes bacterium]|nr:Gfo/Idh/MocA family oxidoreductase [Armatimonadota bacterium]